MENLREELGLRIKEAREKSGLTQKALAELVGIKKGLLWKYENGRSDPETSTLIDLAWALEVDLLWLIKGADPNHNDGHGLITDCHQVEWKSTQLTEDEQELLTMFRKLDPREYGGALRAIELIVETSKYPLRHTEDDDESSG